jgi:DNA polymerase-1
VKKLYIVDAVNFLFRSYYAIGPMTNGRGESTNALFGFIRSIYKIMTEFSPDFIVAVFDGPDNKKSRTAIYADYKSHRQRMPDDLVSQLDKAIQWCTLAGIPCLSPSGVEADDTMGSIAVWAAKQGIHVFLCSSDKDLCQLVDQRIQVVNIHKDNLIMDEAEVKKQFGVMPAQMIDYLAIVGDASDNIPGLAGFGAKTAAQLLEQFGSLDELLAHPEKVAGDKKQATLREGKEVALLSRRLATIDLHVDFPKEEAFFHLKHPEMEPLKQFYQEERFLSLLKELDVAADALDPGKAPKKGIYTTVSSEEALASLGRLLEGAREICLDTETTDIRPMWGSLVGIGFAIRPGEAWYIPMNSPLSPKAVRQFLSSLFSNPNLSFFGHNIKYDLHILENEGLPLPKVSFDTMLASYLLAPQSQRHNLDKLTLEHFHKVKIPIEDLIGKGKHQKSMADVEIDKVTEYCGEDADYTVRLKARFADELKEHELLPLFNDIEVPLIPVLERMERKGIYIDLSLLKELSRELKADLHKLEKEIFKIAGEEFNLSSPKQLSHVLFTTLNIKPSKRTTTGFSTSADVLEELHDESPIIGKILDYRSLDKLLSTYVDALPENVYPETGRIHCTFNQSVAATGRLSCQDPNLQNIPVRSPMGLKIREAFKPETSHTKFLSADYSQIELRLLAHLSEDPELMRAFKEGEDVHAYTASLVFDVPLKEVSPEMRQKAKAVNFGVLYGQQAFGLSQGLKISYKEASQFIDTYFERYKKVKDFFHFCKESVRKTGRAVTMTGRQRPIPEIESKNPILRSAAERLAVNTPLQGTAADLIKIAMIEIDRYLQGHPGHGSMLLQIHDELLFEVPESHIASLTHKVQSTMEGVMKLRVPLEVHISVGKNWGDC